MLIYLTVLDNYYAIFQMTLAKNSLLKKKSYWAFQKEVPVVLFVQFVVRSGNPPFTLFFGSFVLILFEICLVFQEFAALEKLGFLRVGGFCNEPETNRFHFQPIRKNAWKPILQGQTSLEIFTKKNISDESTPPFFLIITSSC